MSAPTPILSVSEVHRISAIAARLQSDHDGEIVNAGRLLVRSLDRHGLRLADVIVTALKPAPIPQATYRPEPASPVYGHQRQARECLTGKLNSWETGFVRDVMAKTKLTERQREVLADIFAKVQRQRAGGAA